MWDPDPRRRRRGRRADELKTEHLLGIEAPLCELSAPPFRFLSLPAEIRNQIYSCHFADTKQKPHYDLTKFKDPAITLVNKQTRREAQPIFFGECLFMLAVGCDRLELSRKNLIGLLGLRPRVHRCLTAAGDAALFRHLHIRVLTRARNEAPKFQRYHLMATICIQTQPKLEYVCTRSLTTLRNAQIVAEKLSAREDFNGYSLDDLTQIVQALYGAA